MFDSVLVTADSCGRGNLVLSIGADFAPRYDQDTLPIRPEAIL
jgi:hypothetical protein